MSGVFLWFEVDDFQAVIEHSADLGFESVMPWHRSLPAGG
jgi:hypothetical protein